MVKPSRNRRKKTPLKLTNSTDQASLQFCRLDWAQRHPQHIDHLLHRPWNWDQHHDLRDKTWQNHSTTVDGRNPTPVDRWFIPLFIGFQPSKVVQDFFHQQYHIVSYNHSNTYCIMFWSLEKSLISYDPSLGFTVIWFFSSSGSSGWAGLSTPLG